MSKLLVVLLSGFIALSAYAADTAKPATDVNAATEVKPVTEAKADKKIDKKAAPAKIEEKVPAAK